MKCVCQFVSHITFQFTVLSACASTHPLWMSHDLTMDQYYAIEDSWHVMRRLWDICWWGCASRSSSCKLIQEQWAGVLGQLMCVFLSICTSSFQSWPNRNPTWLSVMYFFIIFFSSFCFFIFTVQSHIINLWWSHFNSLSCFVCCLSLMEKVYQMFVVITDAYGGGGIQCWAIDVYCMCVTFHTEESEVLW